MRIALPTAAQLQALSAFHGDSAAAWRAQGALLRSLYGELATALVLRPAVGAPRLVALSDASGAVRIDARDPFDEASAALALSDRATHALLTAAEPMRVGAQTLQGTLLASLLASECAIALPLYQEGQAQLALLLGVAETHALAQAELALLGLLANCLAAYLGGALSRLELAEETRRARVEIRDLADVQRLLLPDNPQIRGLAYAIHYQPSAAAGGDYYDLMSLSHRIAADYPAHLPDAFGLMLADVSGHGAGAAMEAVQFDAILRTYRGTEGEGPAGALTYANRYFFSRKARPHFLTALGFLHIPATGEVRLCNAGHLPPLRRRDGRVERLSAGRDIPIGILKDYTYSNQRLDAQAGDLIVVYTDGITEARDASGREFGIDGLERILERSSLRTPEALLSAMLAELYAHQGSDSGRDDQTLIVLRLAGVPGAG